MTSKVALGIQDSLFYVDEPQGLPKPFRVTWGQRNLASLTAGIHPISKGPLLPEAPPAEDRDATGPRCGDCFYLRYAHRNKTFYKCALRHTGGPATDVSLWWPACSDWRDPAS